MEETGIRLRRFLLVAVVAFIAILLLTNIFLIHYNNRILEHNRQLQVQAEQVKVNTLDIIRNLNLLDLGLRGYALVKEDRIVSAVDSASNNIGRVFNRLEAALTAQQFEMPHFYALRDSVQAYFEEADSVRSLLEDDKRDMFMTWLDHDYGYYVWLQYKTFASEVNDFENHIIRNSQQTYNRALRNSYLLQVVIFLVIIPTLTFTAFYSIRSFKSAFRLNALEKENNEILSNQNKMLELMVHERTKEILAQNEEISAQNEEISSHNEQLLLQQREIESQRSLLAEQNKRLVLAEQEISQKNEGLRLEVARQTEDLRRTNAELIEQNSRLEQFAYIISHNLRAPLTRILGLSNILPYAKDKSEEENIVKLITGTTTDIDQIVKDLTSLLEIQRLNTQVLTKVYLRKTIDKTCRILEREIRETKAHVEVEFREEPVINSIPAYIESIFYNLISNAIKYRHPSRHPVIRIRSYTEGDFVVIEFNDNGLGFDVEKNKANLFSLYKRFHFHVEGRGLGLYLVKTQVEALGGKISVTSELNKGTTFKVLLKRL